MNQNEFCRVLALARSSLKHPNAAITNHIKHLIRILEKQGEFDKAESFKRLFDDCSSVPKPKVVLSNKENEHATK